MYFVLLVAAIAILVGVIVVAMGRGGEITRFRRDLPDVPLRMRTGADVAMLRLPVALFGYQEHAADAALHAAARLLAERDTEIARLREELRRVSAQLDGPAVADAGGSPGLADAADADIVSAPDPLRRRPWPLR